MDVPPARQPGGGKPVKLAHVIPIQLIVAIPEVQRCNVGVEMMKVVVKK
jgi:hypothetical protein